MIKIFKDVEYVSVRPGPAKQRRSLRRERAGRNALRYGIFIAARISNPYGRDARKAVPTSKTGPTL